MSLPGLHPLEVSNDSLRAAARLQAIERRLGSIEREAGSSGGGGATGTAGGVLSGTYPNPTFAADMAYQSELDSHAASQGLGGHVPSGGITTGQLAFDPATQTELDAAVRSRQLDDMAVKAGFNMSGGGTITVDASMALSWSTRFIVIAIGNQTDFANGNYWEITMPPDGTVIAGASNTPSVTVASGKVALPIWTALYYILPYGGAAATQNGNYRVALYNAATPRYDVPANWILVAVRNNDNSTLKLGTGHIMRASQTMRIGHVVADSSIDGTHISSTIKDAAAGTASLRTLGTGAAQAAAGDHLHDSRYYTEAEINALISATQGYDTARVGSVMAWPNRTTPSADWLQCDGATYAQATYPALYDLAVAEVAAGNPLWTVTGTNFTVPNLNDKFLVAKGTNAVGVTGGAASVTLTLAQIPPHRHGLDNDPFGSRKGVSAFAATNGEAGLSDSGATFGKMTAGSAAADMEGGGGSHENRPPFATVGFVIKAFAPTITPSTVTLIDAKGDFLVGSANDTLARLAVGTDGQVLTARSTAPFGVAWEAPTGGGVLPEPWHLVGGAGEPAFQNSWVNYSGSDAPARFFRDPHGVVHLGGIVKNGTIPSTVFTLPVGYRPSHTQRFAVVSNSAFGYVSIDSAGLVVAQVGNATSVDFSGITWRAEA